MRMVLRKNERAQNEEQEGAATNVMGHQDHVSVVHSNVRNLFSKIDNLQLICASTCPSFVLLWKHGLVVRKTALRYALRATLLLG